MAIYLQLRSVLSAILTLFCFPYVGFSQPDGQHVQGIPNQQQEQEQQQQQQQDQEHMDPLELDGMPGTQHEFKVDVGPGREDCFFQAVKSGAALHMSFEVLRGADRNVDVRIIKPDGGLLDKHQWTDEGSTDTEAPMAGDYAFCIDNSASRFSHKLVYVYMATYVPQDWELYTQEIENFDMSVQNFTYYINKVDSAITMIKRHITAGKRHMVTDWYLILDNNTYVQRLCLLICFLVVATSCVQVMFVKRLFKVPTKSGASKQRA